MQAIETTAITKRYGKRTALDRLDLQVHRGELFSLLGVIWLQKWLNPLGEPSSFPKKWTEVV